MTEIVTTTVVVKQGDLNRDPLSGEPGAHPLGTGTGATSGGVAGATVGLVVGGPVGGVIGAAVGAIAGGLAGKGVAEAAFPTQEEEYWRETYTTEPYYVAGNTYEYYAPGFRAGWEGRVRNDGRSFDEAEASLKASYELTRSELSPEWETVRPAARAAWERGERKRKVQ